MDCGSADAPNTADLHHFPHPNMSPREVFSYFKGEFGLTKRQTAALMGAHTIGGANRNNSGYAGAWVGGAARVFDNRYEEPQCVIA